ncbi:peroxisome biogenesis protein 1 [Rhodamnia argentea]|uniref:Peroxisomal ATPase PEX1 n=1 Tax=Rhodamnia argentea TaxID=178133 RepID=A0A8B8QS36_9MYRT|nr:peroxisome biogenesis protein 1 [Rhodamnia argentea]XP_030549243.1 peroxisome biogenesis protein 1 [Rhodamnia argentea]
MGLEFEVRAVGGIEDCFVSLPLSLIQTLQQSTPSGLLPHLLTLELRCLRTRESWVVAWSGATSSSSAIEVSQQFSDCISLPDRVTVKVRVISNLPNATLVLVEPLSEDDWEVLELNSEHAEAAILKQVRVLHETANFPLWLHGQAITFRVISTYPEKAVVQLVPGTEVAVAPKRRRKNLPRNEDHSTQSPNRKQQPQRVLLRIQEPDERLIHVNKVNGVELGIVLTAIAYIHPETARSFGCDPLSTVIIMPFSAKESNKNPAINSFRPKVNLNGKEGSRGIEKNEVCNAVVRLLISESVAKGHIMISQSLCMYLGVGLHSWVHVKSSFTSLNKNVSSMLVSPAHFKLLGKEKTPEKNGEGELNLHRYKSKKKMHLDAHTGFLMESEDWSSHNKVVDALSHALSENKDDGNLYGSGLHCLLKHWLLAHLDAIASTSQEEVTSLVLGNQTLLHFVVKMDMFGSSGKEKLLNNLLANRSKLEEQRTSILFSLAISGGLTQHEKFSAYEIALNEAKDKRNEDMKFLGQKLGWGDPASFYYIKDRNSEEHFDADLSSLSWMQTAAFDVVNRLMILLSSASGMWFSKYDLPLPGHVLIHGPPGSGKTLLAGAVAKSLKYQPDIFAHIVFIHCSRFALEKGSLIRQKLSGYITNALDHAPSLVVFDDLDSIISSSSDSEGPVSSTSAMELTDFLIDIVDDYAEKRTSSCRIGPIAFLATVRALDKVPQSLSSSGRFDFHVQLPAPAAKEREAILNHEMQKRLLDCTDEILHEVASKCDGYDAYDLEILVDRAIHAAVGRFMPYSLSLKRPEKISLLRDDFLRALHDFLPVAMRDITKNAPEGGRSGWDDVGGLSDIRNAIKEMIELPSKFPNVFSQAPLRLRSNILLYGPPGCGKTHIVGAAAAACSLRFISVKGPELLNKYIGASEQAVRDIFSKAAAAAPCLLFFDEFDSIAPKRGHDNTGVTDRVVNQFLTELDGVEVLTGVFVFAATSRPDLLDAALLRPGRLDRLLFCDFPSKQERLDIFKVLSRKLPLASDADLDAVAHMTEGFSGADLQALLSDAQLQAVHDLLDRGDVDQHGKKPIITDSLLKSVASKARPSVSDAEKRRLYSIYSEFLDSKRSTAVQSRDAKGKRATLA